MKTHYLHCQDPWFSLLQSGKKIVEGRRNLAKYRAWNIGDIIVFYVDKKSFKARIVDMRRYESLEDYLSTETLAKTLPGVETLLDGMKIYLQWSTREEIAKTGFLAIEVKCL